MKKKLVATIRTCVALFFMLFSTSVMSIPPAFADNDKPVCPIGTGLSTQGNNCKITICHRTNSVTNPYVSDTVSYDAATGNLSNDNGNGDHHTHTGGVFDTSVTYPAPHNGDQWGDIIPPVPGVYAGLNWSTAGQAVYANGCTPLSTTVTPAAVTFSDVCGTANDTYTIPSATGVTYMVGATAKTANTYAGAGSVTVTAVANQGYTLTGTTSWSHTFTDVACTTNVEPAGPTFVDLCGTANDTYTVNPTTGVTYKVGNATVTGTNPGSGTVTIDAYANQGYVLTGTTSWSHTFDSVACPIQTTPAAPSFDEQCGTANDTYTINPTTGVTYKVGNATVTGTNPGSGTVTIDAYANQGYVLTGTTSWSHTFTNVDCPTDLCPNIPGTQETLPEGIVQQNKNECKVMICHRDSAVTKPYVRQTVAVDSVDGNNANDNGQGDHYLDHTGPVFNGTMHQGDNWGDIIPPIPGVHSGLNWTAEGQAIYRADCNVVVVCPTDGNENPVLNLTAFSFTNNNEHDNCPPKDVCPNIPGNQETVPEGYFLKHGKCIKDQCPNLPGLQKHVPRGYVKDNEGNCVTKDVCPNIEGSQATVPQGLELKDGECVTPPTPPTDVCPNIEGTQTTVPSDKILNQNGDCVTPGRGGGETPTPPSTEQTVVQLISAPQPVGGQGAGAPVQAEELVNTGTSALMNLFAGLAILGLTGIVTVLSRRSKHAGDTGATNLTSNSQTI